MIQTIVNKVINRIYGNGRGWVFTRYNFLDLGTRASVAKALANLTDRGIIRRLANGLYDYPEKHPKLGLIPSNDYAIGRALAKKDNLKIQPSGAYAANLLGLSEQVPAKIIFLTDGANRTIKIGQKTIIFKTTTPKNMATAGRISGSVIQALKYIGKDHVDKKIIDKIKKRINNDDRKILLKDKRYAPIWIAEIFEIL